MPIYNHNLPIKANVIQVEGGTDTSKDTVTPETLLKGETAHNAAGEQIVGTCDYNANTENDTVTAEKMVQGITAHDASGQPVTGTLDTEAIRAEGVEAGKKSEHDAFWSGALSNTSNFNSMFAGKAWNNITFKPGLSINFTGNAMNVFYNSACRADMVELFESKGLEVTFNNITNAQGMFNFSEFTRLPVISFASNTQLNNTFGGCSYLVIIDGLSIDDTNTFANTFNTCKVLVRLRIIGVIGKNGFNVSWSPLDKPSLTSIVNALSDTTTGLTVTLRLSAIKKAFETSEGANNGTESTEWQNLVMSKPNWIINAIDS